MENKNRIVSLYRAGCDLRNRAEKRLNKSEEYFPISAILKKDGSRIPLEVTQEQKDLALKKAQSLLDECREDVEILETTWIESVKQALKAESVILYNRFVSHILTGIGDGSERWHPDEYYDLFYRLGGINYRLELLNDIILQFNYGGRPQNPRNKYRKDKVIFKTTLVDSHILMVNDKVIRHLNLGDLLAKYIEDALNHPNEYVKANDSISSSISKFKLPGCMRKTIFDTKRRGYLKMNPTVTVADLSKHEILVNDALNAFQGIPQVVN